MYECWTHLSGINPNTRINVVKKICAQTKCPMILLLLFGFDFLNIILILLWACVVYRCLPIPFSIKRMLMCLLAYASKQTNRQIMYTLIVVASYTVQIGIIVGRMHFKGSNIMNMCDRTTFADNVCTHSRKVHYISHSLALSSDTHIIGALIAKIQYPHNLHRFVFVVGYCCCNHYISIQ